MTNTEVEKKSRRETTESAEIVTYLTEQRINLFVQNVRGRIGGDFGNLLSEVLGATPSESDIYLTALLFQTKNSETGENETKILWTDERPTKFKKKQTSLLHHIDMANPYERSRPDEETTLGDFLNTISIHRFRGREGESVRIKALLSGQNLVQLLLGSILRRAGSTHIMFSLNIENPNIKNDFVSEDIEIGVTGTVIAERVALLYGCGDPPHDPQSLSLSLSPNNTTDVLEKLLTRIYLPTIPAKPQ